MKRFLTIFITLSLLFTGVAQGETGDYSQQDLQQMFAPIALYPDSLLTTILTASTFPDQIDAAFQRMEIAGKNTDRNPYWDKSVNALIDFPDVLKGMSEKREWTQALGWAVSNQDDDVVKAIQDIRHQAFQAGNLVSGNGIRVVSDGDIIKIETVKPDVVPVPVYDPQTVVERRRGPGLGDVIAWGVGTAVRIAYWNREFKWREHNFHHNRPHRPIYRPIRPIYNPSHHTSLPWLNRPHRPGWNANKPNRPHRPGWNANKPNRPHRPGWNANKPNRPHRPGWNSNNRPNRPNWKPNRPNKPDHFPDFRPNRPHFNKPKPGWRPSRPNKPNTGWHPNRPRPNRPFARPKPNRPGRPGFRPGRPGRFPGARPAGRPRPRPHIGTSRPGSGFKGRGKGRRGRRR